MNVLITSVGRRSYLVTYFRDALAGGKVYGVNSDPITPAVPFLDGFSVAPSIYDEKYIPFLLDFCKDNEIGLIVPVFDIDLPILSKNMGKFKDANIFVLVSDLKITEICADKFSLCEFLSKENVSSIKTFVSLSDAKKSLNYPIVVKPRSGMGSLETYIAENEDELIVFAKRSERKIRENYLRFESEKFTGDEAIVFQEFISGKEFGLDIISDLEGNFVTTVVKEKLRMRSGETDAAIVLRNENLEFLGEKVHIALSKLGKVRGNVDVDVIVRNDVPYVIDVNARFGGGYPFTHEAGIDEVSAIVSGDYKNIGKIRENTIFCKGISIVKMKNEK